MERKNVMGRAMGASLDLLRRVGGSEWLDRAGLRKPTERALQATMRTGARAAVAVARTFGSSAPRRNEERLGRPARPSAFDLTPTDEQKLVLETTDRFAADVLRPAAEAADEACAPSEAVLKQATELGLAAMAIPEAFGGAATERSAITTALAAESLAHGDMGLALAILAPLGVVHAIVDHGSAAQQSRYLPAFAGDRFVGAALAVLEEGALFDPKKLRTRATRSNDGIVLRGEKTMVPIGANAELLLVAALADDGPALFLVEREQPGLSVVSEPTMGIRSAGLARIVLDGVRVGADARLGTSAEVYDDVIDRARIGWCALAVGTAQAVLDYVIPYCNDRRAFGEPISHKQAVAFLVADAAIEIEGMRLLTWRAASRAELGESYHREAFLARLQCAEKGMLVGTNGVQLLGGHGFIKDHPVERFYRHLRAVGIAEGGIVV